MKTLGIFSKLGMPGGSENRVLQLANSFSRRLVTYIFAQEKFAKDLKAKLDPNVILREHVVNTPRHIYELQGVDALLVVNSDSYSFCKTSFWDGTQAKHHTSKIDISQIPVIAFLFNYVVGPAQWLVELRKINKNIKILTTCDWFIHNLDTEKKFKSLRKVKFPIQSINSPVSQDYSLKKTPSKVIRINRHSMSFAYKHDADNLRIVEHLCEKYGDKISFKWMGVPSEVRDINSTDKNKKIPYRRVLQQYKQMTIVSQYTMPVNKLLQETDILFFDISRFRKEPWPRTIAEGMMGGCCCVTNNTYGMVEQITSGENGYLFDNADQAIEQLSFLIEDPDTIREVGDNAKAFAMEHFLDDVITDKTLRFMDV